MSSSTTTTTTTDTEKDLDKYTDETHPTRTTKNTYVKPGPDIGEWNDNDRKAYLDIGLRPPEHLSRFERKFLSLVDVSKGPVERTVTHIVRLKAPDYLAPLPKDKSIPERKEWLYYTERWTAQDWRGLQLNPVNHTMG